MAATSTTSLRARRLGRTGLFAIAILAGAACTPQEYIGQFFGSQATNATKIAYCESNMNPNAVSPTNDHGLFQINAVHRGQFEAVTGQPWVTHRYNSYWNTVYANWLYNQQGWGPWACKKVL